MRRQTFFVTFMTFNGIQLSFFVIIFIFYTK